MIERIVSTGSWLLIAFVAAYGVAHAALWWAR